VPPRQLQYHPRKVLLVSWNQDAPFLPTNVEGKSSP